MGAKTWMLAFVDGHEKASKILKSAPRLDRQASVALAEKLFPAEKLVTLTDGDLSLTCPPDDELLIGSFPGLNIIAAKEFGIDHPSKLDSRFLDPSLGRTVYFHAMHSVVDWFAYAIWIDGKLERSLSLSPDSGILENMGTKLAFEESYWSGLHPVSDFEDEVSEYPFPFHPLELGEAALLEMFGYQFEGELDSESLQPESIPLVRFKRAGKWWRFW